VASQLDAAGCKPTPKSALPSMFAIAHEQQHEEPAMATITDQTEFDNSTTAARAKHQEAVKAALRKFSEALNSNSEMDREQLSRVFEAADAELNEALAAARDKLIAPSDQELGGVLLTLRPRGITAWSSDLSLASLTGQRK
jgi:hypothetical protein